MTHSRKWRSTQRALAGLTGLTIALTGTVTAPLAYSEEATTQEASESPAPATAQLAGPAETDGDGVVSADVEAVGFTEGATITVAVDGKPVQFAEGRKDQVDTKIVGDGGTFAETVVIPAGVAPAGTHTLTLTSDNPADGEVTVPLETLPGFKLSDDTLYKSIPVGEELTATVSNLPVGAVVTGVRAGDTTVGPDEAAAEVDNPAEVGLTIPGSDALVTVPIEVDYTLDGTQQTFAPGLTITTSRTPNGEEAFEITRVDVPTGAYQTAINPETGYGFGTSAVGRPPITDSQLYKFDAETLEIVDSVVPEEAPEKGLYAVYGVGLDNEHGTVWVTNTRQDTIAVYRQSDLSLVKQFEPGEVAHSRDVLIDPEINRAYVTSGDRANPDAAEIKVYDTETLEPQGVLDISGAYPGTKGVMMSLTLDPETGELYSTNMAGAQAFKIDGRNIPNEALTPDPADDPAADADHAEGAHRDGDADAYRDQITVYELGDVDEPSGIAWNPQKRELYVASQGSDDLTVLNVDSGEVVKTIPTGARALSAVYEPETDLVYVANRSGETVTVVDPNTYEVVGNLGAGKYPNHVSVDDQGHVYMLNKAGNEHPDGTKTDDLYRYSFGAGEASETNDAAEEEKAAAEGKIADEEAQTGDAAAESKAFHEAETDSTAADADEPAVQAAEQNPAQGATADIASYEETATSPVGDRLAGLAHRVTDALPDVNFMVP